MALSADFEGTPSVSTTEFSLPNNSTTLTARTETGLYQLFLDLNALTSADLIEISIYETVRAGGTKRKIFQDNIYGPVPTPIWTSPAIMLFVGWDMTLRRGTGSGSLSFPFAIRDVSGL